MDRLKSSFTIGIQILCIAIVVWQTFECIVKYTESPQGTETYVDFTGEVSFPSITICSQKTGNKDLPYNETILKICGFESKRDYISNAKWVGSGSLLCQDPKKLNEAIIENADALVDYIQFETYNKGKGERIPITNSTIWAHIDRINHGRCYTAKPTKEIIRQGIEDVYIRTKTNARVYVHSPGYIRTHRQVIYVDLGIGKEITVNVEHEVLNLLPRKKQYCNESANYLRDVCAEEKVAEMSMAKYGCTHPFGNHKDHICTLKDKSQEAFATFKRWFVTQNSGNFGKQCGEPCTSITTKMAKISTEKYDYENHALLRCRFAEQIKVISAFYAYSTLSLIAEIGGNVGLFIGFSFFNLGNYMERLYRSLLN